MELVIASLNTHKIRELRDMLKGFKREKIEIFSLLNFPDYHPPPETGHTFQENALVKAKHASRHLNKWVIADDSGLVIPALKGEPGIRSRRYAGEDASDVDNRAKLLQEMSHLDGLDRSGYFECCIALCNAEGFEKTFTGICEGVIVTKERGRHGFGYDPLFLKHDYDKTFGELDEAIKNRISHRHKAFEKLVRVLETLSTS